MVTITKSDVYRVLIKFYEGNRFNFFIVNNIGSLFLFALWLGSNMIVLNLAFVGGYYLEDNGLVDPTMNMLLQLGYDMARLITVVIIIVSVISTICYLIGKYAPDIENTEWDKIK